MDKSVVSAVLSEMADLTEVESENPFRSRSYRGAARRIDAYSGDFDDLVSSGELRELDGIGDSIASLIEEIWHTGHARRLETLAAAVPVGVRRMLAVPGLGPKKVRAIWKSLGITTIEGLAAACEDGSLESLSGFGAKSVTKVAEGIRYLESVRGRFLLPEAEEMAEPLREHLAACPAVDRLELAGSYRRRLETVKDLDFLVATTEPEVVTRHFLSFPAIASTIASGPTKTSVRLENGMACDLRIVADDAFAPALAYFTGSKDHNTALRSRAKERGLKLSEYGLFAEGEDEPMPLASEEAIYRALDLDWVPPELRENRGEIELAESGDLPELLDERAIRGIVHAHTTWSDGHATLEEMAEATRALGYSYLGVTDHSRTAIYAGGLDLDAVARQHEEIDRLNERWSDFRIFKGIESDILPDGQLDYPDAVLATFDFVIASLHASLGQGREEMTRRVLRALESPHTTILGHPTARLLLRRDGVALDVDAVLERAAELGVAVEINANPHRLDLDWRHGPRARELGLFTSIDPDAHSIAGLHDVRYGVGAARKAGWPPDHVLNTFEVDAFAEFLRRRK